MSESQLRKMSWFTETSTHVVKPWMKWAASALVIFVIVFISMYWRTLGDSDASLYGFWEVDGDFAESADLDSMYVYIGAPNGDARQTIGPMGRSVSIYVFIKSDGDVRFNEPVKSHISRRSARTDAIHKYAIDFKKPVSIIPATIAAEYDPVTQMLILRDTKNLKQVYARLFKKPEISFYCTAESMNVPAEVPDPDDDDEPEVASPEAGQEEEDNGDDAPDDD